MLDLELTKKVVIVSGATGGIGYSLCTAFLEQDALVVALYRGAGSKLDELMAFLKAKKIPEDRLFAVEADLSDKKSLEICVEKVLERFNRIDVLVNNAGYAYEFPFIGTPDEEIDKVFDINLKGTLLLSRHVLKEMVKEKRGTIITISSAVSTSVGRGVSIYAAAKAALNRWTQIAALESAKRGVRINAVAPGAIESKMSGVLMKRAGDIVLEKTPMHRIGQPEEVVPTVLFLASEKLSSFITGQIIFVDGGLSL